MSFSSSNYIFFDKLQEHHEIDFVIMLRKSPLITGSSGLNVRKSYSLWAKKDSEQNLLDGELGSVKYRAHMLDCSGNSMLSMVALAYNPCSLTG